MQWPCGASYGKVLSFDGGDNVEPRVAARPFLSGRRRRRRSGSGGSRHHVPDVTTARRPTGARHHADTSNDGRVIASLVTSQRRLPLERLEMSDGRPRSKKHVPHESDEIFAIFAIFAAPTSSDSEGGRRPLDTSRDGRVTLGGHVRANAAAGTSRNCPTAG